MEQQEKQTTNKNFRSERAGSGPGRVNSSPFGRQGQSRRGFSEYDSKLLDLSRVTRVTKGGKQLRFRAVMVMGDKIKKVGIGVSKGLDVAQAVEKSTRMAKKNMIEVPIVGETIPHEVYAKFGSAKVLLRPQRKGRGLVAGGTVRIICTLAGIKNISSKILGRTSNKLNNAMATIDALKKLKHATTRIKTNS
ncbi:MAG: 30S ribosomal protein S5 [Candidatus Pacebacteria bacterium]|nr:30S ribosomal protein S5 [Candidatus Paceibacterota bacterium]